MTETQGNGEFVALRLVIGRTSDSSWTQVARSCWMSRRRAYTDQVQSPAKIRGLFCAVRRAPFNVRRSYRFIEAQEGTRGKGIRSLYVLLKKTTWCELCPYNIRQGVIPPCSRGGRGPSRPAVTCDGCKLTHRSPTSALQSHVEENVR